MPRKVYVVDDVVTNVELIEAVFRNDQSIEIKGAYDGKELLSLIENEGIPDLLILDLMMPVMDGFEVLEKLKPVRIEKFFPIIILSALTDKQSIINALSMGADDYVTKPFFVEEMRARVKNMLKIKERDELLHTSIEFLESNLLEKLKMLETTQIEIVIRLGRASEFRDNETGKHVERIAEYIEQLASKIALKPNEANMLKFASPMHDVGKIGIPDKILLKPGKLTEDEFKIIQLHTIMGGKILSGTTLPLLELAKEIALTHHERWDGKGYPFGLKGEDIPISGRLVAITDVFDALTSERIYKSAWPVEKAFELIKSERGKQFDPNIVDAFFNIQDKIVDIMVSKADTTDTKPLIQQVLDGDVDSEELIERWR